MGKSVHGNDKDSGAKAMRSYFVEMKSQFFHDKAFHHNDKTSCVCEKLMSPKTAVF